MGHVTPFGDRKTIEAEACAWIAQLDGTEPSQEDLAALREWMNRSPAHRQAIEHLSALWDDLNVLTELAAPRPAPARRRGFFSRATSRAARPVPLTIALSTAVLAVAGVAFQPWLSGTAPPAPGDDGVQAARGEVSAHYATAIGQQRRIELADGSRVMLNTDSRIEVGLHSRARDVRLLEGEALFEVAEDGDRPFRVYAGNGLVRAVGTAFTVRLKDPDNVSVTVTDGEVELAAMSVPDVRERGGDAAEAPALPLARIRAGQAATFGLDIESVETLKQDELSRRLSWRDGMLQFDGEPLSRAIEEVSRYTTQEIVIVDPALRDRAVGGYFKVGDTEAMLDALETSFGVRVKRINRNLVHLSVRQ